MEDEPIKRYETDQSPQLFKLALISFSDDKDAPRQKRQDDHCERFAILCQLPWESAYILPGGAQISTNSDHGINI
jgi:hypothetical protein